MHVQCMPERSQCMPVINNLMMHKYHHPYLSEFKHLILSSFELLFLRISCERRFHCFPGVSKKDTYFQLLQWTNCMQKEDGLWAWCSSLVKHQFKKHSLTARQVIGIPEVFERGASSVIVRLTKVTGWCAQSQNSTISPTPTYTYRGQPRHKHKHTHTRARARTHPHIHTHIHTDYTYNISSIVIIL